MIKDSQMYHLIQQAEENVAKKGLDATDREILLAGLSWVVKELKPHSNGKRNSFQGIVVKLTPGVMGGAIVGILMGLIEIFKGK